MLGNVSELVEDAFIEFDKVIKKNSVGKEIIMIDPLFKANQESSIVIKGASYRSNRTDVRPAVRTNTQANRTIYSFKNTGIRLVRTPK